MSAYVPPADQWAAQIARAPDLLDFVTAAAEDLVTRASCPNCHAPSCVPELVAQGPRLTVLGRCLACRIQFSPDLSIVIPSR